MITEREIYSLALRGWSVVETLPAVPGGRPVYFVSNIEMRRRAMAYAECQPQPSYQEAWEFVKCLDSAYQKDNFYHAF